MTWPVVAIVSGLLFAGLRDPVLFLGALDVSGEVRARLEERRRALTCLTGSDGADGPWANCGYRVSTTGARSPRAIRTTRK